jgi:threonine/homoserine/homoserine lactone efflux protein
MLQTWSTDKIIAIGLMVAFVVTILAMDISAVIRGDMDLASIAKELSIGLFAYLGRGLTSSQQTAQPQQSQVSQTLGKVSETASQAQQIVNAAEAIHDVIKPKK